MKNKIFFLITVMFMSWIQCYASADSVVYYKIQNGYLTRFVQTTVPSDKIAKVSNPVIYDLNQEELEQLAVEGHVHERSPSRITTPLFSFLSLHTMQIEMKKVNGEIETEEVVAEADIIVIIIYIILFWVIIFCVAKAFQDVQYPSRSVSIGATVLLLAVLVVSIIWDMRGLTLPEKLQAWILPSVLLFGTLLFLVLHKRKRELALSQK